ncbi:MAG: hypothetical protein Ct9H300mP24_7910 [Candidatus Neomarinimicrobiota bacterium]|nr:MAG: hypothetical protein Ct9H300mP24_7910 [Candidatus Neomarinimicrobiota bacterium]
MLSNAKLQILRWRWFNYSFDVEGFVDGEVKVSIAEGSVTGNTSGDSNFASNEIVGIVDRVNPTGLGH